MVDSPSEAVALLAPPMVPSIDSTPSTGAAGSDDMPGTADPEGRVVGFPAGEIVGGASAGSAGIGVASGVLASSCFGAGAPVGTRPCPCSHSQNRSGLSL